MRLVAYVSVGLDPKKKTGDDTNPRRVTKKDLIRSLYLTEGGDV